MDISVKVRTILKLLNKAYGRPKPFKATDPVDELVRTVLSQNTNDRNSLGAFAILKKHFRSWDELIKADTGRVAWLIKHAGLANIKAKRIKDILIKIKRRQGAMNLKILKDMDPGSGGEYLKSLKGVGPKTAACVLLFSFGKPVMPVDTHIFRVSKRLGIIGARTTIEEAHEILTKAFMGSFDPSTRPASQALLRVKCLSEARHLIYEGHLGIIDHGRRTCKAQNPRCGFCVLYNLCRFKDKRLYKGDRN